MTHAVFLATNSAGHGGLWRLAEHASPKVAVGQEALDAWRQAHALALELVPELWEIDIPTTPPITYVEATKSSFGVDGHSFGLAFVLWIAAKMVDRVLPEDFVASAAINAHGELRPVHGLTEKVWAIERYGNISRLIVAHDQEDFDHNGLIEVIRLKSAREAFELLTQSPPQPLQADDRAIRTLLAFALGDRSVTPAWGAVEKATCSALHQLDTDDPRRPALQLAALVAHRHDALYFGDSTDLPELTSYATRLPQPHRARAIAHLLQQSSDSGSPRDWESLSHHARTGTDAYPDDLKVAGALARRLYLAGQPHEAFELARDALHAWAARDVTDMMSSPVTPLYLAAVASGRIDEAEAVWREVQPPRNAWTTLARARALIVTGDRPRGCDDLYGDIASDAPTFLKLSTLRWRIRASRTLRHASPDDDRRLFAEILDRDRSPTHEVFGHLLALDDLLAEDRTDDATTLCTDNFCGDQAPWVAGELVRSYPDVQLPRLIADYFPY